MVSDVFRNILLSVLTILLTVVAGEWLLRSLGWKPGQIRYSQWFQPVDSLYLIHGIVADEAGITKVDSGVTNKLYRLRLAVPDSFNLLINEPPWFNCSHEITNVLRDHQAMKNGMVRSELAEKLNALVRSGSENELDSAILHYADHPFNHEGFYSIQLKRHQTVKPRVLLLGDSFTWGHSSTNKTNSFSNILLARGYPVYNTGISGADIPQYNAILKKYLTLLEPQVVVVNVFLGNDLPSFCRKPQPFVPVHFATNAGNLLSFQEGRYINDAEEAYSNAVSMMMVPTDGAVPRLYSETVIGSYLWAIMNRGGSEGDRTCSISELKEMDRLCREHNVKFYVSIIPRLNSLGMLRDAQEVADILSGIAYHQPSLTGEMFNVEDGHFNDMGHRAYADHLVNLIESE
jgi:hypothetical protein